MVETPYADHRPRAVLRMDADDYGVVLRHGDGADSCDIYGARDVYVFTDGDTYYMHYDASGPTGWLCALATSTDLIHWQKRGPILELGEPGETDSGTAIYGVACADGKGWHLFYVATPFTSPAPDLVPAVPYSTLLAKSANPDGPWTKIKGVIPFAPELGTYYSDTASPGQVVENNGEYLMFFCAAAHMNERLKRTLGIARAPSLDGPWAVDPEPILPLDEQVENSSLYYEPSNKTWFLFTNHVGLDGDEYTDAIWVYWSRDINTWNPAQKAIVLDGQNCAWSKNCIGLPSVMQIGDRLAVFYDAPGSDSLSHMRRDIGLAWLALPLVPPHE